MTEVILCRGNRLHAVECAIVRLALKLPASPQDALLDLWDRAGHLPVAVVRLQTTAGTDDQRGDQPAAENALARMVLAEAATPLPMASRQFACADVAAGVPRSPRRGQPPHVRFLASVLFGVCWKATDESAQVSEVYRLAWLPLVDRWVVTASRDVAGPGGTKDRLLATLCHDVNVAEHASACVARYWQTQRRDNILQRWTACSEVGRLAHAAVHVLADRIWPAPCQPPLDAQPAKIQRSLEPA
jgi:hypothetical protein